MRSSNRRAGVGVADDAVAEVPRAAVLRLHLLRGLGALRRGLGSRRERLSDTLAAVGRLADGPDRGEERVDQGLLALGQKKPRASTDIYVFI